MPNSKLKLIIDTDLGDDIDDVLALALAMHHQIEILGITTVFRNVEDRARMAKKLLSTFGKAYERIPVLCGYSLPMGKKMPSPPIEFLSEEEKKDSALAPDGKSPSEAIDFIVDACNTHRDSLTVVAMGPLTNLAHVIEQDPQALARISRVAMMGGAYFRQYADWNVSCDPIAAARVFSSLSNLECIGADVTHRAAASPLFEKQLFHPSSQAPQWMRYLSELAQRWEKTRAKPELVLHDPLLMAHLIDPLLCSMTDTSVTVITEGPAAGLTLNVDAYSKQWMNDAYKSLPPIPRHRVATDVRLPRFHAMMEAMLETK